MADPQNPQMNKKGRPVKFETPEQLENLCNAYFKKDKRPTVYGLALACEFPSRSALDNYPTGVEKTRGIRLADDFSNVISRAKARIEHYLARICVRDKGSPQGAMHLLRIMGEDAPQKTEFSGSITIPIINYASKAKKVE